MSAKELKDKLKKLRMEHSGKAVGKMSPDEIEKEIAHHETACRARELKEKRLAALAKARESKKEKEPKEEKKAEKEPKLEIKEKAEKEPKKKIKYTVMSDSEESSTDSETETIRHRIQKKKRAKSESAE